jgi:hypothetical protein
VELPRFHTKNEIRMAAGVTFGVVRHTVGKANDVSSSGGTPSRGSDVIAGLPLQPIGLLEVGGGLDVLDERLSFRRPSGSAIRSRKLFHDNDAIRVVRPFPAHIAQITQQVLPICAVMRVMPLSDSETLARTLGAAAHPLRIALLDAFVARLVRSPTEAALLLGEGLANVRFHVGVLEREGLLSDVVSQKPLKRTGIQYEPTPRAHAVVEALSALASAVR